VSEPFRDELTAALDRADRLAEENADLRERVDAAELRARLEAEARPPTATIAPVLAPPIAPPPDSAARHTLERLDAAPHGGASPYAAHHRAIDATRADASVLGQEGHVRQLTAPRVAAAPQTPAFTSAATPEGRVFRVTVGGAFFLMLLGVGLFVFGIIVGVLFAAGGFR
jgi:hypothetical protein